ncbi:MAG: NTP transferase domain-containing protein [Epsilonproteobacteria bacterium]|nr:NTP transferase domain-containing protein [Campylobacterota bacterium]
MREKSDIAAILLAGGASSRFKKDKSRLKILDKSLSFYQYRKLSKLFKKVYISTKRDKFDFRANILYDSYRQYLPIYALRRAILKYHTVFVMPVDMPLVSLDSIKQIIKSQAIVHSFFGVYTYKDVKKLNQNIKNNNFSPKIDKKTIAITQDELLNLNYQKDYLHNKFRIKKHLREFV